MQARISRNGEGFAVYIPKNMADELGLSEASEVDLRIQNGCLTIFPPGLPYVSLEELVAGITPENRHEEWDTGPPVGKEIW